MLQKGRREIGETKEEAQSASVKYENVVCWNIEMFNEN